MTQQDIDRVTADLGGKPSARKTGRNRDWPYVPVIKHAGTPAAPKDWEEQVLGLAFKTRDEAVAAAERHIASLRARVAEQLADPRFRALREHYGLPREI